ncbi:winged helix-turn-helix transcriptional regulator [Paenibacillus sp. URB8-2]|nr:winged helix-turn-helix transcriptional regulator [Paenibacillus sp. URB8-2]
MARYRIDSAAHQLFERKAYPQVPTKVEYSLSEIGQ